MAMEWTTIWWSLILLGVLAGVLSGALGVGSGIVLVPTLGLLFAFPQKSSQGMALAVMVPMALLGAFRYWRNPAIEVNLAAVGLIALGELAGTLIGTELAYRLPGPVLRRIFAVFVLIVGVRMLLVPGAAKTPPPGPAPETAPQVQTEKGNLTNGTAPRPER